MMNKRVIVSCMYCVVLLLIVYLTPVIYDSKEISESIKHLYGIFAKGSVTLAFIVFAFTVIKKK